MCEIIGGKYSCNPVLCLTTTHSACQEGSRIMGSNPVDSQMEGENLEVIDGDSKKMLCVLSKMHNCAKKKLEEMGVPIGDIFQTKCPCGACTG